MMFGRPNITGYHRCDVWTETDGAFYSFDGNRRGGAGSDSSADLSGVKFEASRSSAIFGASATVQPSSMMQLACIKF